MVVQDQVAATVCRKRVVTNTGNHNVNTRSSHDHIAQTFIQSGTADFVQNAVQVFNVAAISQNYVVTTCSCQRIVAAATDQDVIAVTGCYCISRSVEIALCCNFIQGRQIAVSRKIFNCTTVTDDDIIAARCCNGVVQTTTDDNVITVAAINRITGTEFSIDAAYGDNRLT